MPFDRDKWNRRAFFHPDIKDILETFRKYQIKVSTTTNLSYLPEELLPHIPGVFSRLSISCDGASPEILEGIRRHGKFSIFLQNVKRVREICGDTTLHMAVTSMRQNIFEALEFVKLAFSLGFDEGRFGRLETNPFLKNEMDSLFHYPNIVSELLQKSVALENNCGIKVMIPVVFQGIYDAEKAKKERERLLVSVFFTMTCTTKRFTGNICAWRMSVFMNSASMSQQALFIVAVSAIGRHSVTISISTVSLGLAGNHP